MTGDARPGRRPLVVAVAGCALGGALLLLAAGREWARADTPAVAGGTSHLTAFGHDAAPALPALGLALLALAVALVGARGLVRRGVGLLVVVAAGAALAVAVTSPGHISSTLQDKEGSANGIAVHASANGWWVVAAVAALLAVAAGAAAAVRGAGWAGLGARYDAPTAPAPPADEGQGVWEALDRGEDPTVRS